MAPSTVELKALLGHGAQTKIARKTKRTLGHVHEVVHGRRRDPKVEAAIARQLGIEVAEIFPPVQKDVA